MLRLTSVKILFGVLLLLTTNGFCQLAEPGNVLVEGYTFTRPEKWRWELPGKDSTILCRFVVPGGNGEIQADVRFYPWMGANENFRQRVLANFAGDAVLKEDSVKVDDVELTYVTITGTTIARGKDPKSDYRLIGVIFPEKEKDRAFFARLFGPRVEVEAATAVFKQMVEEAVRETGG